jgi:hypothetical protein
MNAKEARMLNDLYIINKRLDIDSIYARIKEAAEGGRSSIFIDLSHLEDYTKLRVFDLCNGFEVERIMYETTSFDKPNIGSLKDGMAISW